jgi:hypothetical protein
MFSLEIRTRTVKLNMTGSMAKYFCQGVLNNMHLQTVNTNTMSFLGACWLYNKIRDKVSQGKIRVKLPMEYGVMIKDYCFATPTHTDLQRIANYQIFEQLDQQIPTTLLIK